MTGFINGAVGLPVTIHTSQDYRTCDGLYFGKGRLAPDKLLLSTEQRVADNSSDLKVYQTRWWPRGTNLLGGWGDGLDGHNLLDKPARWKAPRTERGCNGRLGYVGYTRDEYGSALGNCTVRLIRVSTDEMVAKVTSDANGLYFATTPYGDAHIRVTHNAAGDKGGASNTTDLPR